jgi:hypothetical protein
MVRTSRQQKLNESFAVPATNKNALKKGKATTIKMNSGSTLYVIESDNACLIRMLKKLDNSTISDNDFRIYVRTMISPQT